MPYPGFDREDVIHHSLLHDETYLETAVTIASTAGKLLDKSKKVISEIEEQATKELTESPESFAAEACVRNLGRIAALRDNGIIN
jgi:hypothetical protein